MPGKFLGKQDSIDQSNKGFLPFVPFVVNYGF